MPTRPIPFINEEFYHVYNRGVNKRKIFLDSADYTRAIATLNYYLFSGHTQRFSYYTRMSNTNKEEYIQNITNQIVSLTAYVLMPNHFHFLVTQTEEAGISNCLRLFQNSYTRYFNTKHKRIGHLFQGQFKSVHIEDTAQLLHVSRYIHLNPVVSSIIELTKLKSYRWTSYI